ncbi:MAG: type ISP restriction/modification enzyme [Hydrogenovibrio sp.]|jgi:predicted helicase
MNPISHYLDTLNQRLAEGHTSEHTFRADLEALLRQLLPEHHITNEPSKITDCGNPDFVVTKDGVPIGYIEAKDIGKDLNHKLYKEQFTRYRNALDNLVITDYVWFQFFENGDKVAEIWLGQPSDSTGQIIPLEKEFEKFENLIQEFATKVTQAIKSPVKLAELMAGKARLLENILEEALTADLDAEQNSPLTEQFNTFRQMLIHDLEPKQFADLYAQTLAYGLFAARYHDPTLPTFDRDEAAKLIPQSNPLLRNLFQSIAGYNIDERITTTVDNLAEVFRHADVKSILEGFGKSTAQQDPIIHFYETFLAKYDAKLRKARGVWYTPQPVVNFIVRAVDEILKTKFNIKDGLADNSKTTIQREAQGTAVTKGKNKGQALIEDVEVHKVQILDPATGTGTFLAEVVNFLYQSKFQHMQGIWPSYVEKDLIPRLNGFELLMASYAMAHLKLDMLLGETGCDMRNQANRLRVFLTNSLEEYHPDTHTLFSSWLSDEAKHANEVKKDTPVMVVMGNPPYSGESANKGDWIMSLMDDYKKEPGGQQKLQERNPKWINDDYVKFMRFGQHFIEKNGEGILAFINPHGFLDNPTFRGMRWNLLKTYDEIYTIDLHGNAKKKETAPDGSKDENVFDIEQGVSINILVKNGSKITRPGDLGQIYHFDLYGKRKDKYAFLENTAFKDVPYQAIPNVEPMYFMVPKDFETQAEYNKGFALQNLFKVNSVGIVTARDAFTIHETADAVKKTINRFLELDDESARTEFKLGKDARDWKVSLAREDLINSHAASENIVPISYRPFDNRFTYYTGKSKGFHCMPRGEVMTHMLKENFGLNLCRQVKAFDMNQHVFISNQISESCLVSNKTSEIGSVFPLYLYPEDGSERIPNLNPDEIKAFEVALNLPFATENPEKSFVPSCQIHCHPERSEGSPTDSTSAQEILRCAQNDSKSAENDSQGAQNGRPNQFTPIDILDYIYAVLHSPTYRDTYKEFLKTDFPRVPYPNPETFWQLVELGDQIRLLHLMESPGLAELITSYPQAGDNVVTRKITKTSPGYEAVSETHGKVWINDTQYFDKVPHQAWQFFIGGYQPAQKWLKDRQGRELSFDDILHYQKIIVALTETDRLMQVVDQVLYPKGDING